jgi:hypothetical protein
VSGEEEEKKRDEKNFGYRDLDGWKKYWKTESTKNAQKAKK